MSESKFTIAPMCRSEVDIAIHWAGVEGWNPGNNDAECYYQADPKGFLIGKLNGEPISTISVIKYGETFGFLGFYIVKPEFRGQGYGMQIWNAGLDYLGNRNIGLDGVSDQQKNYMKSGFKLAYGNIRYQGTGGGAVRRDKVVVPLSTLPIETLHKYEQDLFPETRRKFVESWVTQTGCHALGYVRNGSLLGYGVIRPCLTGYKIGPLYGDTPKIGEVLYLALMSKATSQPVFLDIPEVNKHAISLAKRYNMEVVFETARMYTLESPYLPMAKIFGVTSFEIG